MTMQTKTVGGVKWRRTARDCWNGELSNVDLVVMGERGQYVLDAWQTIKVYERPRVERGPEVEIAMCEDFSGRIDAALARCVELAAQIGPAMLREALAKLEAEARHEQAKER